MGKGDFLLRTFPQFCAQDTTFKQILSLSWALKALCSFLPETADSFFRFSISHVSWGGIDLLASSWSYKQHCRQTRSAWRQCFIYLRLPWQSSVPLQSRWKFHSSVQNNFAIPARFLYFCIQEATKVHVSRWFSNRKSWEWGSEEQYCWVTMWAVGHATAHISTCGPTAAAMRLEQQLQ